ncbi:hypothetical protein FF38_13290 [Lucilia cuprina]|uniref:Uncharacterized protein n=1 Tax=Lucilia cuprina TaxID=7375 RepID=A0A0L0C4I4_LUCCU|nr:hypothetical protein FF38_13290 [Lucilia cuprina]
MYFYTSHSTFPAEYKELYFCVKTSSRRYLLNYLLATDRGKYIVTSLYVRERVVSISSFKRFRKHYSNPTTYYIQSTTSFQYQFRMLTSVFTTELRLQIYYLDNGFLYRTPLTTVIKGQVTQNIAFIIASSYMTQKKTAPPLEELSCQHEHF